MRMKCGTCSTWNRFATNDERRQGRSAIVKCKKCGADINTGAKEGPEPTLDTSAISVLQEMEEMESELPEIAAPVVPFVAAAARDSAVLAPVVVVSAPGALARTSGMWLTEDVQDALPPVWFLSQEGLGGAGHSSDEITAGILSGELNSLTEVWRADTQSWWTLGVLAEFAEAFAQIQPQLLGDDAEAEPERSVTDRVTEEAAAAVAAAESSLTGDRNTAPVAGPFSGDEFLGAEPPIASAARGGVEAATVPVAVAAAPAPVETQPAPAVAVAAPAVALAPAAKVEPTAQIAQTAKVEPVNSLGIEEIAPIDPEEAFAALAAIVAEDVGLAPPTVGTATPEVAAGSFWAPSSVTARTPSPFGSAEQRPIAVPAKAYPDRRTLAPPPPGSGKSAGTKRGGPAGGAKGAHGNSPGKWPMKVGATAVLALGGLAAFAFARSAPEPAAGAKLVAVAAPAGERTAGSGASAATAQPVVAPTEAAAVALAPAGAGPAAAAANPPEIPAKAAESPAPAAPGVDAAAPAQAEAANAGDAADRDSHRNGKEAVVSAGARADAASAAAAKAAKVAGAQGSKSVGAEEKAATPGTAEAEKPAEKDPKAAAPVGNGPDADEIGAAETRLGAGVRMCSLAEMRRNPEAKPGNLAVAITIDPSGQVANMALSGVPADSEFGQCIRNAVKRLRFSKFNGSAQAVKYSFGVDK